MTSSEPVEPADPQGSDLEQLLAAMPLAAARLEFRRELRRSFLEQAARPASADEFGDELIEGRIREALHADERTSPRRREARQSFLDAGRGAAPIATTAKPVGVRRASRTPARSAPRARSRSPWALGVVAAAAIVLVAFFITRGGARGAPQAPLLAWEVREAAELDAGGFDLASWLGALNAGETVEQELETSITLAFADRFVVRARPGARFRAPVLDRLPPEAPIRLRLEEGELIVRTVSDYAGPPIEIVSADAAVRITGTAVSVMTGPIGTCVCVAHGTVLAMQLATQQQRQEPVGAGETWFSFVEPNEFFGQCYHEAFGHQPGILGPQRIAAKHLAALRALDAEPLFD